MFIEPSSYQWNEFQIAMDSLYDETQKEIEIIAQQLDISNDLASSIFYLRTRSRHCQETENRMTKCYRETRTFEFMVLAGEEQEVLSELGY